MDCSCLTGSFIYRSLVFAYGSGVFQQQGQQTKDNMTDFIFCVEVLGTWHTSISVLIMKPINRTVKSGTRKIWSDIHHIMHP